MTNNYLPNVVRNIKQEVQEDNFTGLLYSYEAFLVRIFSSKNDISPLITQSVLHDAAMVFRDPTAAAIVKGLQEVQDLEMKKAFEKYDSLRREQMSERLGMKRKHRNALEECAHRPHHLSVIRDDFEMEYNDLEKRQNMDMQNLKLKIVKDIDESVAKQQEYLESIGMPLFRVTDDPPLLKSQMELLDLVMQLIKAFSL